MDETNKSLLGFEASGAESGLPSIPWRSLFRVKTRNPSSSQPNHHDPQAREVDKAGILVTYSLVLYSFLQFCRTMTPLCRVLDR